MYVYLRGNGNGLEELGIDSLTPGWIAPPQTETESELEPLLRNSWKDHYDGNDVRSWNQSSSV